jgi:hypothetical protein
LLTIGIVVERLSQLIAVYIVGFDISLMAAVVDHRQVFLVFVESSTMNSDVRRHDMKIERQRLRALKASTAEWVFSHNFKSTSWRLYDKKAGL